ncbi:cytochrome D1 domain-containing protein [Thalassolituus sp. LLYu03]|uniref:cytochrome D1 domain-containing protein n=1 Tax=Thalassolituus sp. LLYu03 TaxID=3421656 RepID=UPI003D2A688D
MKRIFLASAFFLLTACSVLTPATRYQASGDLGVIIARESGELVVFNSSSRRIVHTVSGLGDLSHASVVFSRDERFAYVFGRDGGLTKVDILQGQIDKRIVQGGNSIGGAISQDGSLIAVSNYTPGGVRVFSADTLELVADIPATYTDASGQQKLSKTVGLVDAPGNRFVFSLFDGAEMQIADFSHFAADGQFSIKRHAQIGKNPYDALITANGHYYVAGLFGEPGMARLDLWHDDQAPVRVLPDYGDKDQALPVYKMPHLEGWAQAGNYLFVPGVGRHQVLVIDAGSWQQVAHIPVAGQPVFVMSRPDNREIWVSFAHPDNGQIQIIDAETLAITDTLQPGPAVLHMEFSPRGEQVWVSVRDLNEVQLYDTRTHQKLATLPVKSPSGIFLTRRAHVTGL